MYKEIKQKEMKSLIHKIIQDHVKYSCSISTYKLLDKINNDNEKDMVLRKSIVGYILNNESDKAFLLLKVFDNIDSKLLLNIAKLSLMDFVSRGKILEGIEFVKEHFKKKVDKSIYTLVGYCMDDKEVYSKFIKEVNREKVIQEINSYLYLTCCKRKESLLHSTVSYYNTLKNNVIKKEKNN